MSFTISSGLTTNPLRDSLSSKWIDVLHELDVAISELPAISDVTCKAAIKLMQEHGISLSVLDELQVIGQNCPDWPIDVDLGNLKSALISSSKAESTVEQVLANVEAIEPEALEFMLYLLFESKQKTDQLDQSLRSMAGGVAHQPTKRSLNKPAALDRNKRQAQEAALQASEKSLKDFDASRLNGRFEHIPLEREKQALEARKEDQIKSLGNSRLNDRHERVVVEREKQAREQREWQQAQKTEVEEKLLRDNAIIDGALQDANRLERSAFCDAKKMDSALRMEKEAASLAEHDAAVVDRDVKVAKLAERSAFRDAKKMDSALRMEKEAARLAEHDAAVVDRDEKVAKRAERSAFRDATIMERALETAEAIADLPEHDAVVIDRASKVEKRTASGFRDALDEVKDSIDDALKIESFAKDADRAAAQELASTEERIALTVMQLQREIESMQSVLADERIALREIDDVTHTFEVFAHWVHEHPLYEHIFDYRHHKERPHEYQPHQ